MKASARGARPAKRTAPWLLALGGVLAGLVIVEILLRIAGLPRWYRPRSTPPQFAFLEASDDGIPVWVNVPEQRIRFVYDGNPRGYFGAQNEVDHVTNSLGFRGPEFPLFVRDGTMVSEKPAGTERLVFLGDSFTFGEGVRFEDAYPEVTARLLQASGNRRGRKVESYNLGVGGYNTRQELYALQNLGGLALDPDVVVVGYVLNDAEAPLFYRDPASGEPARRRAAVEQEVAGARPPDDLGLSLRMASLLRKTFRERAESARTVAQYRALYDPANRSWQETRAAVRRIVEVCRERGIPAYVLLFPVLYDLGPSYPFEDIHALVREAIEGTPGGHVIDLLPLLRGRDARALWVHPTDQHPNEQVHALAAAAIVEALTAE